MPADLVGLGKIGVRLIEKISDATGVLYPQSTEGIDLVKIART